MGEEVGLENPAYIKLLLHGKASLEEVFAEIEIGREWVTRLLHQLRHGKESRVIGSLQELVKDAPVHHPQALELVTSTADYFLRHEEHIHYAALDTQGVPIGSGAMESQCSQFQDRFKCTGQFWSDEGFANLLAIETTNVNTYGPLECAKSEMRPSRPHLPSLHPHQIRE